MMPDPDEFFENLDMYQKLSSITRHHTLPILLYTGARPKFFHRVFKVSQLGALEQELTSWTGREVRFPHANASGGSIKLADLSIKAQAVLAAQTERDYAIWADYFDTPFEPHTFVAQDRAA